MGNYGAYSNKNRSDIVLDEGAETVKNIQMEAEACAPLTHQPIDSIPKEFSGLLLEPFHNPRFEFFRLKRIYDLVVSLM
jgi:hypothetical protein